MTSKSFVLTVKADSDLAKIYEHTLENWGAIQAERYVRKLVATFIAIANQQLPGLNRDHIRPGLKSCLYGSHVIFYRQGSTGTIISRVLHQSMDVDSQFKI